MNGDGVKLIERSAKDLLVAFRSPNPTPGGGSAAALAGAVGASLFSMVAGLPKSRAATGEDVERLKAAGDRCAVLATELESLVDRDSDAYNLVVAAYKKPKGSDEEKAARSAAVQDAMRAAIAAPMEVMRACAAAAEQGVVIAGLGNRSAASDLLVGMELVSAALRGAKLNVEINLGTMKDQAYVAGIRKDVEEYERAIGHEAAAAFRAIETGA